MAKTVTKQAKIETFNSQTLPEPIVFSFTVVELEKGDAIPDSERPDEDDLRTYVNTKRTSKARAKAQNDALEAAGIQKPTLEDPDFRLKQMVKILVASGMDETTANVTAKTALGMQ